jgi:hypothetical protein
MHMNVRTAACWVRDKSVTRQSAERRNCANDIWQSNDAAPGSGLIRS